MKMSNNSTKYEVLIKQYLRSILDMSARLGTRKINGGANFSEIKVQKNARCNVRNRLKFGKIYCVRLSYGCLTKLQVYLRCLFSSSIFLFRKLVTDFCENLHKRVSQYSLQSQVFVESGNKFQFDFNLWRY